MTLPGTTRIGEEQDLTVSESLLATDETDTAYLGGSGKDLLAKVGDRVRCIRRQKGHSRRELSEMSGVSVRYLAQLEGGEGNISIALLNKVALALETPLQLIFAESDVLSDDVGEFVTLFQKADPATRMKAMRILDTSMIREQKAERICLIGLRGAGKSTLGDLIGRELGIRFIELNKEVEKAAGMALAEVIALYGQVGYRRLEAETLVEIIATKQPIVMAVAGGIVDDPESFERLLAGFHTIWVKASPNEHMERVRSQGDLRPMAGNPEAMAQLRDMLKERESKYLRADYQLDTGGKSIDQSVAELRALIINQSMLEQSTLGNTSHK